MLGSRLHGMTKCSCLAVKVHKNTMKFPFGEKMRTDNLTRIFGPELSHNAGTVRAHVSPLPQTPTPKCTGVTQVPSHYNRLFVERKLPQAYAARLFSLSSVNMVFHVQELFPPARYEHYSPFPFTQVRTDYA